MLVIRKAGTWNKNLIVVCFCYEVLSVDDRRLIMEFMPDVSETVSGTIVRANVICNCRTVSA